MSLHRIGDLEISQDLEFEHRSWRVQRIGWALFALTLLAALLGLLGGAGPLSRRTAGAGSPLQVAYERFTRHNSPTQITLQIQGEAIDGDQARIWVSARYLEAIQIQRIEPPPAQTVLAGDRVTYVFPLSAAGADGRVVLHIMPQALGLHEAQLGIEGVAEQRFTQLVYP